MSTLIAAGATEQVPGVTEQVQEWFRERPGVEVCAPCLAAELSVEVSAVRRLGWHPLVSLECRRGRCARCTAPTAVFGAARDQGRRAT